MAVLYGSHTAQSVSADHVHRALNTKNEIIEIIIIGILCHIFFILYAANLEALPQTIHQSPNVVVGISVGYI